MKIVIIGAVAAGTSCGAKARRNDETAEITIYEKEQFISYSGCGMPYYLGNDVKELDELVPRDPSFFKKKYNIDVKTGHEVLSIDKENKTVTVLNHQTKEEFVDSYDKLVLATGASAFKPKVNGLEKKHVFFLRNINDVMAIKEYLNTHKINNALIAGTGFIGFEVLENLMKLDINVSIVELASKITPNLDEEMALYLENELKKYNVNVLKNCAITEIGDNVSRLSNGEEIIADIVIMATGVRPNVELAKAIDIKLGVSNAIVVNNKMETSEKDIYACGDCIETYSLITNKPTFTPLGSTANKTGRICGDAITNGTLYYKGNLKTGIFKIFDIAVASTGLNEQEAIAEGYDIVVCHNIKPDKPAYMNGTEMIIKAIADKKTERIIGVQIIGKGGVDKRIDVFATLITYKAKVDELFHLDLAYAPPFSTTKDPVHYTGMILDNSINHDREIITANKIEELEDVQIVDARSLKDYESKGCVKDAINIPQAKLRAELPLDKNKVTITYCNKGVTGNAAQNILINQGFKKVYNLSGGHRLYKVIKNNK